AKKSGAQGHFQNFIADVQVVFVDTQGGAGCGTGFLHRLAGGFLGTDHSAHSSFVLFSSDRGTVLSSLYFSWSSWRAYSRRRLFISLAEMFFSTVWPVFSSTTFTTVLLTPRRCSLRLASISAATWALTSSGL